MKAEIITIGDEILIGQIVDTNSAWMAEKLNQIGIEISQIVSISDQPGHIKKALDNALQNATVVLITGGLGPTRDDKTKQSLAEYFNTRLEINQEVLERITKRITSRGYEVNELNRQQAALPLKCEVLVNNYGTASGMLFRKDQKIVVSMPGVPFEMKGIMEESVLPFLQKLSSNRIIVHKTLVIQGHSEAGLAELVTNWEDNLPEDIKLAYLPSPGRIRLRFSASGTNRELIEQKIQKQINLLEQLIPGSIVNYAGENIEKTIGQLLLGQKATLSTAESCTGGNIAHMITSVPGSSAYFKGSIIAYSNHVKEEILNVSKESLIHYGAVSQEVVEEMAVGAMKLLKTDYGIATSGIAGPGGGTQEKPVGTVWIAVASNSGIKSKLLHMGNDRLRTIQRSSLEALNLLRKVMLGLE